jgi:hypothetical protein
MSWVKPSGCQAQTPRVEDRTDTTKARVRAVAMVQMQAQGWSLREIAGFFGINHPEKVRRIINQVPPEARKLRGPTRLVG